MRRIDTIQPSTTINIPISHSPLTQSFVPLHHNINSIQLIVFNTDLQGNKTYKIEILDQNQAPLRMLELTDANLGWGAPLRFDFAPIADSKDQMLFVAVSQLNSSPSTATNSSVQVNATARDVYAKGELVADNQPTGGDLSFQLFYQTTPISFMKDAATDITRHLLADPLFTLFYILIQTLIIKAVVQQLIKKSV